MVDLIFMNNLPDRGELDRYVLKTQLCFRSQMGWEPLPLERRDCIQQNGSVGILPFIELLLSICENFD